MSYVIRPADFDIPGEKNMIRKSWLRSGSSSAMARVAGEKAYYSGQHDLIDQLLDRCETRVACSETSKETILGWTCAECVLGIEEVTGVRVLHYAFVVEDFRRHGIAKALLESFAGPVPERVQYTHRTDVLKQFKLPGGWFFNPYKLMVK